MKDNFEQLVNALNKPSISSDILQNLTNILKQQIDELSLSSSFIDQSFQSLIILEQWAWELLSENSRSWINQCDYQQLFYTLGLFNKKLIFTDDGIDVDKKGSLLFTVSIEQINQIFQQINTTIDDNDPYITIVSLWFDNHSHFIHDNPHCNKLSITDHINHYIASHYLMNEKFKIYLKQLRHLYLSESIFTSKMLFYIKTCLCSLFSYLGTKIQQFPYTPNEILRYLSEDYLQIIHIHNYTVSTWNKNLLACIGHLMAVIAKCYWFDEKNGIQMKILFPTEQIACDHVQELIHIVAHKPFHLQIKSVRSNDETILIDSILMMLINIVQLQNINWFFRLNTTIQDAILLVAEASVYDEVCLRAYTILGEVLTDEQVKDLNIAKTMAEFFFKMFEQAWNHPSKEYKQIPIEYLIKDFQILCKNESIQQTTANSNKISLFVNVCEEYPAVYQILWTLSFNRDIQEQLRLSLSFMLKLSHLAKECKNEEIRKIIHGILWNLEIYHDIRPISNEQTFDIMISYSHKDKNFCKKIYEELTKAGYRVWIDFDQIHGNFMDAMAQAIERANTIIICMSESYRKSNYCRAEAHYAFQRQLKIVPILLQKHYKPDGWLLFLIGQLVYVNFTKYEFSRAMEMLLKEIRAANTTEISTIPVCPRDDGDALISTSQISVRSENILDWTSTQVQDWLIEYKLIQICRVFAECDGRSLVYLNKYLKQGDLGQILNSLQEDSLRRTNQNLSFIELSRFQSLMDQYYREY